MPYGLYVHIPYCRSRCRYCDFHTSPGNAAVPDEYVQALERQFKSLVPKMPDGTPQSPVSVYFGGGTPSLLAPAQLQGLLKTISPAAEAEITLEANPESATLSSMQAWREAGVNRLSLGVQSTHDESLRRLGRLHTAADARTALQNAHIAGFQNISADIMLALPQYSNKELDDTLALLHEEGATHISAYLLKVEEGTAFFKNPPPGLPVPDEAADFYEYAVQRLAQRGYAQYEISNFARPGFEGQHNLLYWNCEDYLGIGPAAHSCVDGQRFYFDNDTAAFIAGTSAPKPDGAATVQDYIMLRLRLTEGLSAAALCSRYGYTLTKSQIAALHTFAANGLAMQTADGWALTPAGFLVQNAILVQLL